MSREQLVRFFFLGVLVFLLFEILHILSPFYTGILGAIVLTLIFYPLHRVTLEKIGFQRPNFSAAVSTILVLTTIFVPFFFFSWLLLSELTEIYPLMERFGNTFREWRQENFLVQVEWLRAIGMEIQGLLDFIQSHIQMLITETVNGLVKFMTSSAKKLPKNTFLFAVNLLVMIFTLFFLFRDGLAIMNRIKELVPMDDKHKDHIASQLYVTVTAVVRGMFIVAITQGTLAGIGFAIVQVPSPAFLGLLTMFVALIPLVGATVVWLPVSVYYLAQGAIGKGIFLFLWGALVVSLVDNFIRPIVIGSRAKLPILFLFFGLLGGVRMYGPMGLFLGPLVVALLIAFIRIYREEYQQSSKSTLKP